jgi:PAS domain S-box-containing protein
MKNKSKPASRPKKKTKSALKKTPAVKAALLGKKKKSAEKTGKNKIGTPDNANQHKMEKELRETKERLRLLSEAAEEGIAIHDNGVIIDANDALARIFGYELSEMIGMNAESLATPESWKVIREHISKKYDKTYEGVGIRKDGSTFLCSLVGKPYKYKGRTLRLSVFRDITELKKMEEKYRNILENIQEGYFEVDIAGNYTFLNDSMCRIHGYPKKELMGMNNRQYTKKEVAKKVFKAFNGVYKTGKPLNYIDWQIIRKDGVKRYIEASVSLRKDSLGKPIGFRGIIRDITERKKAEVALRESANRLRAQYNGNPIPTFTWQKQGDEFILTEFNDSAKTFTSGQSKTFLGRQASEMYKSRWEILRNLQRCFNEKKIIRIESRSEHFMPGKFVVITFVFVPPDLVMVHMEDITERKQVEEALRQSEKKYRIILENIQESYFEVDLAGNLTFFNDSVCRVLGYSRKELMGMNNRQYTDKEESKKVLKAYNKVYKTGKPIKEFGYWISRKDGIRRYIEGSVTLLKNSSGKPTGFRGITNDFTERKQAEEKLRESEKQYRTFFKTSRDCVFITSIDGSWIDMNDAAVELFGYSSRDELMRVKIPNLYAKPEDRTKHISTIIEQGNTYDYPVDLLRKDGGIINTLITSAVRYDADGKAIGFMGTIKDITERKQAEESLKETELKFRTIFDSASDGIILLNVGSGKFSAANEKICDMLGYTKEELLKLSFSDIHPEESIPYVNEQFKKIMKKEILVAQNIPLLKKDKTVSFADISGSAITLGEKEYSLGVFRDITERKQAETSLRNSEIKYRNLFESASDTIFLMDKDIFIDCNQEALNMFGCTREQIIGQPPYRFSPEVQPDGRNSKEKALEKINAALRGQPQHFEWKHIRYDGTLIDAEISLNALNVNDMGKYHIQALCRDITERKKVEEELKKHREHLEELVRERTINLEAANKELEAFSYSASHDLRAPLRSIDGFSQALLEDCEDKLDIQGKDYLIRIRAATRRMAELIEDLMQLSRITLTEMSMEKINLTRIARSVRDELQKSQPQRHVEIKIVDGLEDTADSKLMRIVLENLLGNAWKFTGKQAKTVIEFGFTKKGKKKVYFIRDNGSGFDMAYADKLFAPFQRLHTEEEFPGTGIGLATVRRIIHRHGGKVWAEGQTGKGATFYFSLNEK